VFIANLPIYGLHAIVALYTSRRLHLNPLAALLGRRSRRRRSGVSGAAAIAVGHVLLHGAMPVMEELNVSRLGGGMWSGRFWWIGSWVDCCWGSFLGSLRF
jgi:hypothetical protein